MKRKKPRERTFFANCRSLVHTFPGFSYDTRAGPISSLETYLDLWTIENYVSKNSSAGFAFPSRANRRRPETV